METKSAGAYTIPPAGLKFMVQVLYLSCFLSYIYQSWIDDAPDLLMDLKELDAESSLWIPDAGEREDFMRRLIFLAGTL